MPPRSDERRTIRIEKHGDGITWLYMNRPEKRNAVNPTMNREMVDALDELEGDDETRVLVLTGAGSAFCAGQDLKEFFRDLDGKPKEQYRQLQLTQEWRFRRLYTLAKPTIAMVNGWCVGGAFTQLFSCDYAIAAEEAQFCLSEINWGIIPGGIVSKVIAECLSFRDALYYLTTADTFDGRQASAMRLVNYAVPQAQLREATVALAQKLMAKNPATLMATKIGFKMVRTMDFDQSLDYLMAKNAQMMASDPERGRDRGLSQFLDSKAYRPALSPYPRES